MPQVKEPVLRKLIREAIREAELTAGPENTAFSINVDLGNKQSETKLGLRIQLKPKDVTFLEPGTKDQLEAAIMTKINNSLEQFNIQISKDTDVPDPEIMGFFIPLAQLRNLIISSLKGPESSSPSPQPEVEPKKTPTPSIPKPRSKPVVSPNMDMDDDDNDDLQEQEDPLDRAARLAKEPIAGMGLNTGLGLKRKGYENEEGGPIFSVEELYENVTLVSELLIKIYQDINNSDYAFKEYLQNNEDQYTRVGAVMSMLEDELEDRLEVEEPVDEKGIEEIKEQLKTQGLTISDLEQSFAQNNPQEYRQIEDRYIAQGGRPGDARWISFFFRMAWPKGYGWEQLIYGPGDIIAESTKNSLNEMRVRDLNEASKIIIKEDFYNFINAGNNMIRTFEENGKTINEAKKYMKYLLAHNIM